MGCLGLFAPYLLLIARRSVKKCSVGSGRDRGSRYDELSTYGAHDTKSIQPLVGNPAQAGNLPYFGGSRYDEHPTFGWKPSTSWQSTISWVLTIRRASYLRSETQHELATDYTSELTIRRALLQPKRNRLIISGSLYDYIMSSPA